MERVTLKEVNHNILLLRKQVGRLNDLLEEASLDLADDVKDAILASRARPRSAFKTQEEMERALA
ncbi:MAG: hypothetical protein HY520_04260 [Candidatus Aenigmarchaeota archaeon]|nr:hypothetical protein [Candidatus Aenigmarchaeota archaeon]